MPIYEYQCTSCGFEKEVLQKLSDPLLEECPACKEATFKKKLSAPSFRLKGGGWYETDFKTGDKKNLASNDTPSTTSSAASTSASPADGATKSGGSESSSSASNGD